MPAVPLRTARVLRAVAGGGLSAAVLLAGSIPADASGDATGPVPAPYGPAAPATRTTLSTLLRTPSATRALPAAVDARPSYQGATSCDPVDRPGSVALGRLLVDTYGVGTFGVSRLCTGGVSEHHEGRAVDWMLDAADPADAAVASSALTWITANDGEVARRLGIQYVIWNRQTWRAYAPERGWTPYTGASPHTDHIHLSLTWDGALRRTSWWTGSAVSALDVGPCRVQAGQPAPIYTARRTTRCATTLPAPPSSAYPVYMLGARHADVGVAQKALGIAADGQFGAGTRRAVLNHQKRVGLPRTGALDNGTWVRLVPTAAVSRPMVPAPKAPSGSSARSGPTLRVPAVAPTPLLAHKRTMLRAGSRGAAVTALQRALRVPVTGVVDARTTTAVRAVQKRWKLPVNGVVNLRTWNRVELGRYPWTAYLTTPLKRGAKGPAVRSLQGLIGVGADGIYGAKTQSAVAALQRSYGLSATGAVDAATWRAVADRALR